MMTCISGLQCFNNLIIALFLASILVLNLSTVSASFVVKKDSIRVLSPLRLLKKHDGAISNFGKPDHGGFIIGSVVYPDKGANGCEPFDGLPFKSKLPRPSILLLDRGGISDGQLYGMLNSLAAAVLVADSIDEPLITMESPEVDEPLITMESPEESFDTNEYVEKIGIPSALIEMSFADSLKKALKKGENVVVKLDWTESMPHPNQRVKYELWTYSNDGCGIRCDEQINFVKNFKGHAQILEKGGYTLFTPHYITWYCPQAFVLSRQCKFQCINHGRYCAPDPEPEQDFGKGYQGKDVVLENLRQLCVHRVSNESKRSWVWWDYATDFHIRCSMKEKRYSKECAEDIMHSLDLPIEKIKKCMGDPEADVQNEVLKTELELQDDRGSHGGITILPTLVINGVQYREKLERSAVLKTICAGFQETTQPPVCLNSDSHVEIS